MKKKLTPRCANSRGHGRTFEEFDMSNHSHTPGRDEYVQARIAVADTGCWEWMLARDPNGYGYATWNGLRTMAHRFSYETYCDAIPEGLVIDHLCRNTACVNPAHLEPVPQRINLLRGESPMAIAVRSGRCVRNHEMSGANLYVSPGGIRKCRACLELLRRMRYERDKKRLGIPDRRSSSRCGNPNCDRREHRDGLCTKCHGRASRKRAAS